MAGMVVITLPSFSSCCPCWTSGLHLSFFTVLLLVLRLVSVRSPFVRFACRWLCSSLACCWLCSCACCWLCSSRFFSTLLQVFDVILAVLVPVLLYFVLLTTCSLAVVPLLILSPLAHFVVGCDSVARFWLPPTSLLSVAPFVIDGSR